VQICVLCMELYELWINNCMHFGLDCINFGLSIYALCMKWRERGGGKGDRRGRKGV
jgi:hypothetical protein